MLNRIYIVIAFFMLSLSASAQISVLFIPEIYGRSMDGLMNARILNASGKTDVRLSIQVTENRAGRIVNILTPPFTLVPGNNTIPGPAIRAASIQMGENSTARFIQRSGYLPQGSYEYSYRVISAISVEEVIVEQTFAQEVLPPAPLDLIAPYNEDKICNKMPVLTWQPSIPVISGTLYELLMVEIKERQSPVEALNYNLPIVKQKGIPNPILLYPPSSKELQEGKRYAWQVTAYKDQTVINRSEVWEFTVDCKTEPVVTEDDNGYRDIDDLLKGNYYIAKGLLKFTLVNSYTEQKLKYEIACITEPGLKVKNLPKITLQKGQNKIKMDFSRNFSFKDGYSYLLKTYLPNGTSKSLRFIYKDVE